ncbi:thioredoxin domain-containing protein [Lentzea sp. BCCO 10_0856]|uniref:Thioredoxin domain-containing protein n=1 Tax=Lentzea miocenica TaxID=3095431 RepID=A0ABU4TEK1_9PSEU|nr:thioredoxin domain-containing protein [Lentzea sp. BCCO 10_0856]MDX8036616.1 thioredoxin domain-containing protein [Lentzea sp. BCCO 10_0856]
MTNRLADATSPYLLQHADNPVDWWPWGAEAFEEARRRNVPVLLSVGYAACHWCHVMAHESFEDESVAAFVNARFVPVKVDREERPDVDAVYMEVTQAMTGSGGWPMTVFLTPDARPFHAGTYYPPSPRQGMPSFTQLVEAVSEAWTSRPDDILESASVVVEEISRHTAPLPPSAVDSDALAGAVVSLLGEFDRRNGGFGGAPKFPSSMVVEFLLRHHERTGSVEAISMATSTADAMANGGMYDQLGGGFARYSVDASWVVPHFEKMLYDNALLLRFYTHLSRVTGSERYERVVRDTAAFLLRDLRTAQGGFAASLDADTEGVEGSTYVWSFEELGDAAAAFGVTEEPNFEDGKSTLRFVSEPGEDVRASLLARRAERAQPGRDDKVIAAWNGMAIAALAEAGAFFGEPSWIVAASEAATLLASVHLVEGRLLRTSRDGVAGPSFGVLEDYGCLADGLLALHQVTGSIRWLDMACGLLDTALSRFAVPDSPGAYYDTADDAEALVRRPADSTDNASPSGASSLASALLTASLLSGAERSSRYASAASDAVTRAGLLAARAPRFAGHWLTVAEALVAGPLQVAVVGAGEDPRRASLWATAVANVPGGGVVVSGEPGSVPLLEDRPLVDEAPAAYVCRGYVCDRPVVSADALVTSLTANTL